MCITVYFCLLLYISDISLLYYWISCNISKYFLIISTLSFCAKNNPDQWYHSMLLLVIFQCIFSMSYGYINLGIDLVSLEDNHSHTPKKPSMEEEKKNDGAKDSINLLLE
jgi:hypothetical protein